jgi:ABC-type multidrug transport system ATPase subunit
MSTFGDDMLTIQNLKFSYPNSKFTLSINNLALKKGEIVALIGANGCGKSTFYRAMVGAITPYEQCIIHNGKAHKNILETNIKIGFHNAFAPLIETITVKQNILLAARLHNVQHANECINYYSRQFDVLELLEARPEELSAGQQHRVKLVRSLIHDPDVILFDEPTTASDINQIETILGVMPILRDQGKTIIISTHHLYEISVLTPRLIGLENGKIAFDNSWTKQHNDPLFLRLSMKSLMSKQESE